MAEIAIKVAIFKGNEIKDFYVSADSTVKELKDIVCKEFGSMDPNKHTLYRVDYLEEPVYPLRREKS